MVKLFLVKHGESMKTNNDTILSKKGIKQAKLLAKKLASLKISKVYASDYTRALQTYEEYRKLKPTVPCTISEKLREINRVIIGGPERFGAIPEREKNKNRADEIIDEILENAKDDDSIALFIHGNLIRYFIAKILKISGVNLWEKLMINDASITLIEITNDGQKIKMINNTDHLSEEEVDEFYNLHTKEMNYFS